MRNQFFIACVLLLLSSTCIAQTVQSNPVTDLKSNVMSKVIVFEMATASGSIAEASDAADQGQKELDTLIAPALKSADGHPDLVAAIKAFYVSAKTYFDTAHTFTPLPTFDPVTLDTQESPEAIALKHNQVTLKQDVDAKEHAMMLEARLAGLDGG